MSRSSDLIVPLQHDTPYIEAVQIRIRDGMYHSEDASKKFIGQQELHALWADLGLRTMFPSQSWEDHEIQTIRDKYLKVLSILVMIAWPGVCGHDKSGFRKHFLQRPDHDLADQNLPLTKVRLGFLKEYAINFLEKQYTFCPAIIEEREDPYIQEVAADRPLPFTEEELPLGEGASGKVRKVVIARYCFRDKEETLNAKEMHVACKTFHIDDRAENFRKEFRRLGWVKGAKDNIRIMKHIAALAHGGNVMILLPIAEHFDLDVFLRHGYKPTRDTKDERMLYDFDPRFPCLKDDELGAALVKELCELASAVQWLHEGNEASQSLYRSLAHMDLKPENILVAEDSNLLIGKWMLSDFGVSLFGLSQEVSQGQSARTTTSSYFDEPRRGRGAYQPPEIKHLGIDGRKCDVWSFGCILVDVMSFALGRKELFQKVRALRNRGEDDYFYHTKLDRMHPQTAISNANTKIKTPVRHWLKDQKKDANHPRWIRCYIDIIELTLKCDPRDRPEIGSVVYALSRLQQADTAAFLPESASRRPSNWAQQLNTAGIDQAHKVKSREVGEVSVESEILIDTENALLATSGDIESYSPLSESRFDSCDSFGRQDRDSVVMTDSGSIPIGLYRASVATDGSRSIQIGLETEPRFSEPTHLSLRSGPQDLQDRPLDVKISPENSRTSLRFKDTEKIIALAVSPSGDQAAFLFSHRCRVYATSGNTAIEKISIKLERKVKWTRLCIGSAYLVIYGTERGPKERGPVFQNRVLVLDVRVGRIVWEFSDEIHGVQVSDVIVSMEGVTAGAYGHHLLIHDLAKNVDRAFDLEQGLIIKNLAFSANGKWLCAWVISINQGCDRSYFWEISEQSIDLRGSGVYRRVDDASTNFALWCYPTTPSCVLFEKHYGLTSIVTPNGRTDQNPESRQDLAIPGLLNACITPRHSLIYVVKPPVLSRRRETRFEERFLTQDLATCISKEGTTHGAIGSKWENTAVAVAAQSESTELLILCTFKKNMAEIVKYTIDGK